VAHAVADLLRWDGPAIAREIDSYAADVKRIFDVDREP
jgi:hypothetical protein